MTGLLLATGCPFQWQHQFVNEVPSWIYQSVLILNAEDFSLILFLENVGLLGREGFT